MSQKDALVVLRSLLRAQRAAFANDPSARRKVHEYTMQQFRAEANATGEHAAMCLRTAVEAAQVLEKEVMALSPTEKQGHFELEVRPDQVMDYEEAQEMYDVFVSICLSRDTSV
ncbi:MAG: hypothetical protein MHM6MM_005755 [Cercozoa sp. M6MM]